MNAAPGTAIRTYLEMRTPSQLNSGRAPGGEVRIERVLDCPPSFWRYLYSEVGRRYRWVDRQPWTDEEIRSYLNDPAISLWLMTVSGAPAGYFELRRGDDTSVEIVYFGLLQEFQGRGLGSHMLATATGRAWESGATRVWLHTNTQDHPAALRNYLSRGFTIFRTEEYTV
jgi:ribosomal protein S18 acetylase RimI-like enzyme